MICVLYQVKKHLGETVSLSLISPIWGNIFFPAGRFNVGFKIWADNGIQKIGDLYNPVTKHLRSFEEIGGETVEYYIPRNRFFQVFTIAEFHQITTGSIIIYL